MKKHFTHKKQDTKKSDRKNNLRIRVIVRISYVSPEVPHLLFLLNCCVIVVDDGLMIVLLCSTKIEAHNLK